MRIQIPNASDLTLFDCDHDISILRNITGRVKEECKDLFKNPSGASNLRVNSSVQPHSILELLSKLLAIYNLETFKDTFPSLLNVTPVKDPETISRLNEHLLTALKNKDENLYLTIPEIIDYQQISHIRFKPKRGSEHVHDLFLERYYQYLEQTNQNLKNIQLDDIHKQKISLMGNPDSYEIKCYQLFKCFFLIQKSKAELVCFI